MTAKADPAPVFHLFPRLPPELRLQIWRDALPAAVGPGLYSYKQGCWGPGALPQDHPEHDSAHPELNLTLEFRHDLLGRTGLDPALASASREAREVALRWAAAQGGPETRTSASGPLLVRAFDPGRDVLYVSLDDWDGFCSEPLYRPFEEDMVNRHYTVECSVSRVAVAEAFVRQRDCYRGFLQEMCEAYKSLTTLYVILDLQPGGFCSFITPGASMTISPRWEINEKPVMEMAWQDGEWSGQNSHGGRFDKVFLESLQDAADEWLTGLADFYQGSHPIPLNDLKVKIRVVSAHRVT